MKKLLKNKKGFTLLEVLVTIGIVGVLSAIAIPAYNQYKQNANETAVKLEVSSAQKAYLAYEVVENTFCVSLAGAGIGTIGTSAVYTNSDDNFAGFNSETCTVSTVTSTNIKTAGSTLSPTSCVLDEGSFKLGAAFEKTNSQAVGYWISDDASGPTKTTIGGACSGTPSGCTAETTRNGCIGVTGCSWIPSAISDVCA